MGAIHANRGQALETLIEHANAQYAAKGIAQIQKVATPWKVIRRGKQIVSAFPEKKSTVDFIGVYQGRAIAFDAKQTENKTRFPLANIEQHQLDFMINWELQGGAAFFLIEFKEYKEIYFLPFVLVDAVRQSGVGSIPYTQIREYGIKLGHGNGIVLDYLQHIEVVA